MVEWSMATDRHAMAAAMTDVMTTDAASRSGGHDHAGHGALRHRRQTAVRRPPWLQALWGGSTRPCRASRLIRVDASRHFIMADQPARFDELVDEFLR